jgi:hypothetical protein
MPNCIKLFNLIDRLLHPKSQQPSQKENLPPSIQLNSGNSDTVKIKNVENKFDLTKLRFNTLKLPNNNNTGNNNKNNCSFVCKPRPTIFGIFPDNRTDITTPNDQTLRINSNDNGDVKIKNANNFPLAHKKRSRPTIFGIFPDNRTDITTPNDQQKKYQITSL